MKINKKVFNNSLKELQLDCYGAKMIVDIDGFLNSVTIKNVDNKFEINAVEILYSLPVNSFTLINDEENNIYLAKVKKVHNELIDGNNDKIKDYIAKQNTNSKNRLLKSYDFFLVLNGHC